MAELEEGQFSVRGLVMGPGTPYFLMPGTNPFRRSVRADQSAPRAWGDGSQSGAEWQDEVVMPFQIRVDGDERNWGSWLDPHDQLAAAFSAVGVGGDEEVRWVQGGREFVHFGRPRMVEPEMELVAHGRTITQAAFVALDPIRYSGELVETVVGLPEFEGGLTVPFTVPFSVDAVAIDGEDDIWNEGTSEVSLLLRISGPVNEPRVSMIHPDGTVQTMAFDIELQDGQWLDVDTKSHSVLMNGTVSRRGVVSGSWLKLPGVPIGHTGPVETTKLLFRAAEWNDEAEVTAQHRHGWK